MIKAIIFDLDGLLVDSQPLQYEAHNQAFTEKGYPLTKDDWYIWIHQNISAAEWVKSRNLPLVGEEIRARKKEIYEHLIKTKMELKVGARELIDLVAEKFPLAVASGSRIESIDLCIDKFNLRSKFKHLISDQHLSRSKPHPEVFLHVAEIMNVEPSECLVFEDSLAGLQAAKSAGMKCVICPDNFLDVEKKIYKTADKLVDRLDEVTLEDIEELSNVAK